jgi:hypothetical protein
MADIKPSFSYFSRIYRRRIETEGISVKWKRPVKQYRDPVTGKFVKRHPFYRLSTGLNFYRHGMWFGALYQKWFNHNPTESEIEEGTLHVIDIVEKYLGYDMNEWWFAVDIGVGVQEDNRAYKETELIEEDLNAFEKAEK